MTRNMDTRVEIIFPIYEKRCQERLCQDILQTSWQDNQSAYTLQSDGSYKKRTLEEENQKIRSQALFSKPKNQQGKS